MVTVDERLIDVAGVAQRCRVSMRTVYRWFDRGLESMRMGGVLLTSLEALQRFSRQSDDDPLRQLKQLGVNIGSEARTDGHKAKQVHRV